MRLSCNIFNTYFCMRILVCSTSVSHPTGYARIGHVILTDLSARGHDVYHFAFQHPEVPILGDRVLPDNVTVIPVKDFGYECISETVARIAPDIVLVYNDVVVTSNIVGLLQKNPKNYAFVSYLDLVYLYEDYAMVHTVAQFVDTIFVFSDIWKAHLECLGVHHRRVHVFPHGFDDHRFHVMPKSEARRVVGLPESAFVVLNTNRNSYRKALDVTIRAFLMFWSRCGCPDDVMLMLNCCMDVREGYDIHHILQAECAKLHLDHDVVVHKHVFVCPGAVTDAFMNAMYNACDVGLNTCIGEGFGLCNLEHACLDKPQIVTDTGGLSDIFSAIGIKVPPVAVISIARSMDPHLGDIAIPDADGFATALETCYLDKNNTISNEDLRQRYHWPRLLDAFHTALTEHVVRKLHVYWINLPTREDRRDHMMQQFDKSPDIKVTCHAIRVPADVEDGLLPHVSCMHAHYRAIHTAYTEGCDIAVVMEDDVVIPTGFGFDARSFPSDWECVQLHYINPHFSTAVAERRPPQGFVHGYFMSCACYVMNRRGMDTFLNRMGRDCLAVDIDPGVARAEEFVYRYVNTYCAVYPLVTTDPTLGSDIPGSFVQSLQTKVGVLGTNDYPVYTVPYHTHWHDTLDAARRVFTNIVVLIPGFGEPHVPQKKAITEANIAKLRSSGYGITIKMMQYSGLTYVHGVDTVVERPGGTVGGFLKECDPATLPPHDAVVILLDDVELMDDIDIGGMVRALDYCDIVSPAVSVDSPVLVHAYMSCPDESPDTDLVVTTHCELFCYVMKPAAYAVWWSNISMHNPWLWGMDLMLHHMGLRVGLVPKMHTRHHFSGAYDKATAMDACRTYIAPYTFESLMAQQRCIARIHFQT